MLDNHDTVPRSNQSMQHILFSGPPGTGQLEVVTIAKMLLPALGAPQQAIGIGVPGQMPQMPKHAAGQCDQALIVGKHHLFRHHATQLYSRIRV